MKMYHLNPNTYGPEWFVMAESADAAMDAILKKLSVEADEADALKDKDAEWTTVERGIYENILTFKKTGVFDRYTLKSYDGGEVVESEIC
jgi:hypothetical protein